MVPTSSQMRMADTIRLLLAFTSLAASSRAHVSVCDAYQHFYDPENRPLQVVFLPQQGGGGLRAEFEYDALGRLISSWVQRDDGAGDSNDQALWYYHDGANVIAEYTPSLDPGDKVLARRHIHGTARIDERAVLMEGHLGVPIISPQPTAECYYYLLQDLDTVAGMMKQNGGPCESMVYAGYGRATTIGRPRGDFNRDGHVTPIDLPAFLISGPPSMGPPTPDPAFDLDLDGDRCPGLGVLAANMALTV